MPNRLFQGIINQMRDAIDRTIGAAEQGVDTETFGIPSELDKFTKLSKNVASNADPRFKSLFAAIKENSEIRSLKLALKYLCDKKYTSDSECLREMFMGQ